MVHLYISLNIGRKTEVSKRELNTLVDSLISIKDSHKGELSMTEVDAINKACNVLEVFANEQI